MADIKLWSVDLYRIDEEFLNSVSHFIKLCNDNGYVMTIVDQHKCSHTYVYGRKVCQWLSMEHDPRHPQQITALNGVPIKKVDAGLLFFAVLTYDGDVFICSSDTQWQTDGELKLVKKSGIKNLFCGAYHLILMQNDNRIFAQGLNIHGQLGIGSNEDSFDMLIDTGLDDISTIACGKAHCLAWTNDNRLLSWGCNEYGQLGLNNYEDKNRPAFISLFSAVRIKQITTGKMHSAVLMLDGTLFFWGTFNENKPGFKFPKRIDLSGIKIMASNNIYNRLLVATENYDFIYSWITTQVDPQIVIDQEQVDPPKKIQSFSEAFAKIYLDIDNYRNNNSTNAISSTPLTFEWTKNIMERVGNQPSRWFNLFRYVVNRLNANTP